MILPSEHFTVIEAASERRSPAQSGSIFTSVSSSSLVEKNRSSSCDHRAGRNLTVESPLVDELHDPDCGHHLADRRNADRIVDGDQPAAAAIGGALGEAGNIAAAVERDAGLGMDGGSSRRDGRAVEQRKGQDESRQVFHDAVIARSTATTQSSLRRSNASLRSP